MPKWASAAFLDGGLNALKNTCTSIRVISQYSAGDPYETVVANTLANVTTTSADFTISGAAGAARVCTSAAKTDSAANASGGGANNHIAFCDASSVIFVTDESSDQVITIGNPIVIAAVVITSNQPT